MAVARTTVSLNEKNWKIVKNMHNRSAYINEALDFYQKKEEFLKAKEEEFILSEIKHFEETGEFYSFEETFN